MQFVVLLTIVGACYVAFRYMTQQRAPKVPDYLAEMETPGELIKDWVMSLMFIANTSFSELEEEDVRAVEDEETGEEYSQFGWNKLGLLMDATRAVRPHLPEQHWEYADRVSRAAIDYMEAGADNPKQWGALRQAIRAEYEVTRDSLRSLAPEIKNYDLIS